MEEADTDTNEVVSGLKISSLLSYYANDSAQEISPWKKGKSPSYW